MVQLNLTPKQVEELKNHYILELQRLQTRTAEIMSILGKLAQGDVTSLPAPSEITEIAAPATVQDSSAKRRGRPSNKPNITDFIIETLTENKKPMTTDQLIRAYKKKYQIDLVTMPGGMAAINQVLFRLRAKLHKIVSKSRKGKRGKVYALATEAVKSTANKKPTKAAKPKAADVKAAKPKTPKIKAAPKTKKTKTAKAKQANAKKKTPQPSVKITSGRDWPLFITETLHKQKRVLTLKELLGYAMVQFSIPAQEKKATLNEITAVLSAMLKAKDQIMSYKKEGSTLRHHALKEWFTDNKELITTYK
jgi:hypothetical protein